MTRCAIYCRISDDREGRSLGVERQEQQCRELAARLGLTVAEVYVDNDISASRHSAKARPAYQRMLADARHGGFAIIIAATTNRLTRRPRELEDLLDLFDEAGTTYEYVKSPRYDLKTAAGRKFARYAAADDAAESDEISERVRDRLDQRRAEGLPHGGKRPYGWEMDRVTVRESEAEWIRWGVRQTLAGVPVRAQYCELNERGVRTATGREWRHVMWRDVLMTARHAGLMTDGRSPAGWPAIISPEEHRAVVRVLGDPARVTTPGRGGRLHLLSGIATCALQECGRTLRVGKSKGRNAESYDVYRCYPAGHVIRSRERLDEYVREVIAERLRRPDVMRLFAEEADESARDVRRAAEREAERLRRLIDDAAAEHAASGLPFSALAAYTAPLNQQLATAEAAATPPGHAADAFGDLADAEDKGAAFLALTVDRQRTLVERFVTIVVGKGARGNIFDYDSVDIQWR